MRTLFTLLLALVPAGAGASLAPSPPPGPQPLALPQDPAEKNIPHRVGYRIRDEIVLEDLAGAERNLFEAHEEQILVLVFWSLRDPVSRGYKERLEAIQRSFAARAVKLYLIDSNHDEIAKRDPDPLDKIREYAKKEKLDLEILVDRDNVVADRFGALCASHTFVVDGRRYLRYSGGVDDDARGKKPAEIRQKWLENALDELLAGKKIAAPLTRPVGRKIKRAPKPPPGGASGPGGG